MVRPLFSAAILFAGMLMFTGCTSTPEPTTPQAKQSLNDQATSALAQMKAKDPGLQDLLNRADGYVIFPSVGEGGAIVGGAYGRGEVYEHGQLIGYAELKQGSVGLQLGGQTFSELLVFDTPQALQNFKSGNFTFSANATAVALKAGAASSAQFENGVAAFTMPQGGLMAGISIAGQKFTFEPLSGATTQPSNQ